MQVLSWKPRAVYFPDFATAEQCQTIIDKAKTKLKPSGLALRPGETADSTKGIRTRYFLTPFPFLRPGRLTTSQSCYIYLAYQKLNYVHELHVEV